MTAKNRHQRRAAAKAPEQFPAMPPMPNISGTEESCANCRLSCDPKIWQQIQHLQRLPVTISDEVLCLHDPGGGRLMKSWGWCSYWTAKE